MRLITLQYHWITTQKRKIPRNKYSQLLVCERKWSDGIYADDLGFHALIRHPMKCNRSVILRRPMPHDCFEGKFFLDKKLPKVLFGNISEKLPLII